MTEHPSRPPAEPIREPAEPSRPPAEPIREPEPLRKGGEGPDTNPPPKAPSE